MNSDLDNPNHDVPPVTPGGDWEHLDKPSEEAKPNLFPRKPDRGLPAKREQWRPQVNQYAPKPKLEENVGHSTIAPGRRGDDPNNLQDIDSSETSAQDMIPPRKVVGRAATLKWGESADVPSGEAGEEDAAASGRPTEERVVLPPLTENKRSHVNEINPTGDVGKKHRTQSMVPKIAKGVLEEEPKKAGELRRRFVRGEHGDWGKKTGKGSFVWMAVTGVCVIALVVAAVVLSQRISKKSRGGEDSIYSQFVPIEEEASGSAEDLEMLEIMTNSQDEAKGIFASYATAKTPTDFLGSIYRADDNVEVIQMRWEPLGMKAGWTPGDGAAWNILERDGMRYGVLSGSFSDYTRFSAYFRRDGDELKMDWKATSGYGTADFGELKKGQGDGSEIRAWMSHSDFYTFALPEGSFRSFRLMSPDGQTTLWGYTKVGSELDGELLALFVPSEITGETQTDAAVVLGLEPGPEESLPNQWMISKLVRLGWLDE